MAPFYSVSALSHILLSAFEGSAQTPQEQALGGRCPATEVLASGSFQEPSAAEEGKGLSDPPLAGSM